MTGMGNIGASYKYCRKSPYEAKAYFFGLPSSICSVFWFSSETLLIFQKKFLLSIFCLSITVAIYWNFKMFFQDPCSLPVLVFRIFSGAVAEQVLWNLLVNYFVCSCTSFEGVVDASVYDVNFLWFRPPFLGKFMPIGGFSFRGCCICVLTLYMLRVA